MSETVIQMYGGPSTDTDGVSSIDVPEDGEIMGVQITMQAPAMVEAKEMQCEISFLSSSQFTTNDARGVIARNTIATSTVTTNGGANAHGISNIIFHKGLSVNAGERIHLHFETSDTALCRIHALIQFKFKGGVRTARRR